MNTQLLERPAAVLSVVERAELALGSDHLRAELAELVLKSANIKEIKNKAGHDECHSALMVLRNTRTGITAAGKSARDDATKFSKAVIAEEAALILITEAEEQRLLTLREAWTAQELVVKEHVAAVAREQAAVIQHRIDVLGFDVSLVGASAVQLLQKINDLGAIEISLEVYGDRAGEAQQLQAATLEQLNQLHDKALFAEAQQLAAAAQQAKLDAERAAFEIQVRAANEAAALTAKEAQEEIAKQHAILQLQRAAIDAEVAAAAKVISDKAAAEQKVLDDAAAEERALKDATLAASRALVQAELELAKQAHLAALAADEVLRDASEALLAALIDLSFQVDQFQWRTSTSALSTDAAHAAIQQAAPTTGDQS